MRPRAKLGRDARFHEHELIHSKLLISFNFISPAKPGETDYFYPPLDEAAVFFSDVILLNTCMSYVLNSTMAQNRRGCSEVDKRERDASSTQGCVGVKVKRCWCRIRLSIIDSMISSRCRLSRL